MCIALCGKGLAGCWYFDNIFMHMFAYVCTFVYIYPRECKRTRGFMKSHDMAYVACFLIGFVMLALGIGGFISLGMIVKDWMGTSCRRALRNGGVRRDVHLKGSLSDVRHARRRGDCLALQSGICARGAFPCARRLVVRVLQRGRAGHRMDRLRVAQGKAERHESIVDVVKEDNAGHLSRTGSVQLWKSVPRQTASKSPKTRCRKKTVQTE